jgi:hypothetical protein
VSPVASAGQTVLRDHVEMSLLCLRRRLHQYSQSVVREEATVLKVAMLSLRFAKQNY